VQPVVDWSEAGRAQQSLTCDFDRSHEDKGRAYHTQMEGKKERKMIGRVVLLHCLDTFIIIYLDDILIFSKNPKEHQEHVREVLTCLQKNQLFAKPEKCEFSINKTEFLGFEISPNSISMSQSKVDAILKWPTPKNLKQVQSFLGFTNFY